MNYPDCIDGREDCLFRDEGSFKTLMYSPLITDRYGKVVSGGGNRVTTQIYCTRCCKRWRSEQTELDDATGKSREWGLEVKRGS